MCSIAGMLIEGPVTDRFRIARKLAAMMDAGAIRGRDAFGVAVLSRTGVVREWKGNVAPAVSTLAGLVGDDAAVILANTRATPTTEFTASGECHAVQPVAGAGWIVVHNGTIANDHEVAADLALGRLPVDSAVLPHLFARHGFHAALDGVMGSWALAAVQMANPGQVHLARNFKPLHVMRDTSLGAVCFASLEEQLVGRPDGTFLAVDLPRVVSLPPYSEAVIAADGSVRSSRLETSASPRRTLVIASGGLDSTVAATALVRAGVQVELLHYVYGCRAEASEVAASTAVASALGCRHRVVSLRWLGELGGSTLTAGGEIKPCETGAEFPFEWVPARNMVMIAQACAIADAEGFDAIALGTNLEEGGSYPDNTQEFVAAMDHASVLGTLARTRIIAPLGNMVKHEIVRLGARLDAPMGESWSCYERGAVHCGRCGPCFMRRVAFEVNGLIDPTTYARPLVRVRPVFEGLQPGVDG